MNQMLKILSAIHSEQIKKKKLTTHELRMTKVTKESLRNDKIGIINDGADANCDHSYGFYPEVCFGMSAAKASLK